MIETDSFLQGTFKFVNSWSWFYYGKLQKYFSQYNIPKHRQFILGLNRLFQSTDKSLRVQGCTSNTILMACYKAKAVLLSRDKKLPPGFVKKQNLIANFNIQFFSLKIRIPSHKIRDIAIHVCKTPIQMTAARVPKYFKH